MAKNIWTDNLWGSDDKNYLLMHELDNTDEYGDEKESSRVKAFKSFIESDPNLLQKVVGGKYESSAKKDMKNYSKNITRNAKSYYDRLTQKAENDYDKDFDKIDFEKDEPVNPKNRDYWNAAGNKLRVHRMKKSGNFEVYVKEYNPFIHSASEGNLKWDDTEGLLYQNKAGELKTLQGAQFSEASINPNILFGGKSDQYFTQKWTDPADKENAPIKTIGDPIFGGKDLKYYTASPKSQDYLKTTYDAGAGIFKPIQKAGGAIKDWMQKTFTKENIQRGYEPNLPKRGVSPNPATVVRNRKNKTGGTRAHFNAYLGHQPNDFFNRFPQFMNNQRKEEY
jgi:hypothetical protein